MLCHICNTQQSKYKCPKCNIPYCSLNCYKSQSHIHTTPVTNPPSQPTINTTLTQSTTDNSQQDEKWQLLLQDDELKHLLSQPVLQFHLLSIINILTDDQGKFISKGLNYDQKIDIANLKLQDLRTGGVEQNEIVEQFVQRVIQLTNDEP